MRQLFVVGDVFRVPGKGLVVAGVNPQLDELTTEEFQLLTDANIVVRTPDGSTQEYSVGTVETSTSIAGSKNFFILLPEDVTDSAVRLGSIVFALR